MTGLPTPSCTWQKDGAELKVSKDLSLSFKNGEAVASVKKAVIESSGTYKLIAKNEEGESADEVIAKVKGIFSALPNHIHSYPALYLSNSLLWFIYNSLV